MSFRAWLSVFILVLSFAPSSVFSHENGITDTQIKIAHSKVRVTYTVPQEDLTQAYSEPGKSVASAWSLENDGKRCTIESLFAKTLDRISSRQFIMLFNCHKKMGNLSISDNNLYQEIAGHENYIRILVAGRTLSLRFSKEYNEHKISVSKMLDAWRLTLSDSSLEGIKLDNSDLAELRLVVPEPEFTATFTSFVEQGRHYFSVGVEHIVFGYDHLLFLLGLVLLPLSFKQVLYLVSTFSLAHTVTLALSVLDVITLPVWLIESTIALSIVYIAIENIFELRKYNTQTNYQIPWKRRLYLSFAFGLIHGFGFSFILREIGLADSLVPPLVFFNLGVEVGQLAIISLVYPIIIGIFSLSKKYTFSKACSFLMAILGTYWLLVRVTQ